MLEEPSGNRVYYVKSSQQQLRERYELGDPTMGLLGEPSGRDFDYYVVYSGSPQTDPMLPPSGWGSDFEEQDKYGLPDTLSPSSCEDELGNSMEKLVLDSAQINDTSFPSTENLFKT